MLEIKHYSGRKMFINPMNVQTISQDETGKVFVAMNGSPGFTVDEPYDEFLTRMLDWFGKAPESARLREPAPFMPEQPEPTEGLKPAPVVQEQTAEHEAAVEAEKARTEEAQRRNQETLDNAGREERERRESQAGEVGAENKADEVVA